jgi:Rne/Rng family ribonuclease
MSKELVISANRHETKVASLEDDQLVEVFFQRSNEYSLAGSIHKGRVTRVLPGMQSAFVDLGLERDTFLYVSDFFEENEDFDHVAVNRERAPSERGGRAPSDNGGAPVESRRSASDMGKVEPTAASDREPAPAGTEASEHHPTHQAGSPSAPQSAPLAAPQSDRQAEGDRGDRRGRRSRRRNRGRGFPESKYAPEVSRQPRIEAPPASEPAREASAPPRRSGDFSVLPGESLAKYTRSNPAPLDEGEEEEIHSLQNSGTAAEDVAFEAAPPALTATEAPEAAAESDIAASAESEAAGPEEPVAAAEAEAEEPPSMESELEVSSEGGVLLSDLSLPDLSSDVPSDREPAEDASPSPQLTAQVREQSGRYPHRAPRRMRRKMRGAALGEPRGDRERRPETAHSPAVERGAPRTEQSRGAGRSERSPLPSITELLKEGQEIIVQIAKEPLGQKGARITSHIALPGRYVVYMPTVEHTGVSRKIASDDERQRLKRILQIHHPGIPGGFIVRTAGEGKSEEDLAADMNFLSNLWLDIRQKAEKQPAPLLLHHDLDIVQRTLRDQFTEEFKAVWVDNEELYENVVRFVQRFHPGLVNRIKLFTRAEPIFDAFGITAELEKALRPKVWLKSGGYIVINQTEALVAIDVNTGKYVGRSNRLEDTIVKTNTEALKEIVRQIRLRDLGGIIVVDFIDMDERSNRQKVMAALEDAMRSDRAPYKILQFNDFGLVAITRKRVKQSLERALCMPCPHCEGAGYVKSVATIVSEIIQEARKIANAVDGKDVMLRVHPDVAKFLKSNQNKSLEEMEEILRRPVLVKGDPLLHHEKFDLT